MILRYLKNKSELIVVYTVHCKSYLGFINCTEKKPRSNLTKENEEMAHRVGPDQMVSLRAIWSWSILLANSDCLRNTRMNNSNTV